MPGPGDWTCLEELQSRLLGTGLGFHWGPLENPLLLGIPKVPARPQQVAGSHVSMLRLPVMGPWTWLVFCGPLSAWRLWSPPP